jgi:hypothetical protein
MIAEDKRYRLPMPYLAISSSMGPTPISATTMWQFLLAMAQWWKPESTMCLSAPIRYEQAMGLTLFAFSDNHELVPYIIIF